MGRMARFNPLARSLGGPTAAPMQVRDAVGRVLELGDEVIVITPKQPMRVAEIKPIMDPGAPPNAMMVVLVTRMAVVCPRDQGIEDLYFTRHQAEIGDKAVDLGEQAQDEQKQQAGAPAEPSGTGGSMDPDPRD